MQVIELRTHRQQELVEITGKVQEAVRAGHLEEGAVLVFVPHTTAGVLVNENADPSVTEDILSLYERIVPTNGDYRHSEGNSAAHVKSTLVGVSLWVPVSRGTLLLGTWQGIFFAEFDGPRSRKIWVQLLDTGENKGRT
jgi:secondary thiamine-phosphate synthase enzyme